jgi:acetamidase/formamidase
MLGVHILSIKPHEIGFTCFGGSTGAMPAYFGSSGVGSHDKVVKIVDGKIRWSESLTLTARPMLGFVGTSPRFETHNNGWAGTWGGNLDMQEVCAGATVYLPVEVEGAFLHVGDMHALQGDGEICGAGGIETGGSAILRCSLHPRPSSFRWPRVVNESHIMIAANAKPAEEAFRMGLESLILWIEEEYGMERGDAYLLLGQILEARVTQFVNPTFTYCLKVSKSYLEALQ